LNNDLVGSICALSKDLSLCLLNTMTGSNPGISVNYAVVDIKAVKFMHLITTKVNNSAISEY